MDITCSKCKEPWDLYGLVHDDGIFECDIEAIPLGAFPTGAHRAEGFTYVVPDGFEEAREGHFLILSCPCCPNAEEAGTETS